MRATSGFKELQRVLADFRSISALMLKGSILIPLANLWARLGPPPVDRVAAISAMGEALTILAIFHLLQNATKKSAKRCFRGLLGVTILAFLGSALLLEFFTEVVPLTKERVVLGFSLRPEMRGILGPTYSISHALRDAEYEPSEIWTATSLSFMRVMLPATWIATLCSLAGLLASFVIMQRRISDMPSSAAGRSSREGPKSDRLR